MNVKNVVVIEIEKGDFVFSFSMPVGAPFGQAYDAAFEVLQQILEFSQKAADQVRQNNAENAQPDGD